CSFRPASGKVGPDLSNVASKKSIAGGAISPVNEDTLTRWIKNPQALKPGTTMPNLGLSNEQARDIVQWLLTLK
ncbi:MAG: c-type cytochrome, partial [Chloroflexota bacterium]